VREPYLRVLLSRGGVTYILSFAQKRFRRPEKGGPAAAGRKCTSYVVPNRLHARKAGTLCRPISENPLTETTPSTAEEREARRGKPKKREISILGAFTRRKSSNSGPQKREGGENGLEKEGDFFFSSGRKQVSGEYSKKKKKKKIGSSPLLG